MKIKRKIKKLLQLSFDPFALELGYVRKKERNFNSLSYVNKHSLLDTFFTTSRNMGFEPTHILDVGANHGTWTRNTLHYFPNAHYSLFEPQKWLKKSFVDILSQNPKVKFYPVGAGEKNGVFNFTLHSRDDSSSFRYKSEEAKSLGLEQIKVDIVTLNDFVKNSELPIPELVKIDAEGLDIQVLNGADFLFGKTEVFMVEGGVSNKEFDNSLLYLMNYMDSIGYRLFDITDLNRPFPIKLLWLVEVVFVKKNGILDSFKIPQL